MKIWFGNNWNRSNSDLTSGIEIQLIGIWIDFWAIDITILNFTIGFRIK